MRFRFLECKNKEDIIKMLYRVPHVKKIIQLFRNKKDMLIMVKILELKSISLLKSHSEVQLLRHRVRQTIFCHIGSFFEFYPPNNPQNQNFLKNEKNIWRCHHFTHAHPKSQSYDVWFLRYGVRQTQFFIILSHFLSFYLTKNPEN